MGMHGTEAALGYLHPLASLLQCGMEKGEEIFFFDFFLIRHPG